LEHHKQRKNIMWNDLSSYIKRQVLKESKCNDNTLRVLVVEQGFQHINKAKWVL